MIGMNVGAFIHLFSKYLLRSTSEIGDAVGARADAMAGYGSAFKELIILEGFNGDIVSYK